MHSEWVNYMACELYLNKVVKTKKNPRSVTDVGISKNIKTMTITVFHMFKHIKIGHEVLFQVLAIKQGTETAHVCSLHSAQHGLTSKVPMFFYCLFSSPRTQAPCGQGVCFVHTTDAQQIFVEFRNSSSDMISNILQMLNKSLFNKGN